MVLRDPSYIVDSYEVQCARRNSVCSVQDVVGIDQALLAMPTKILERHLFPWKENV
jgi:hypothetical protein